MDDAFTWPLFWSTVTYGILFSLKNFEGKPFSSSSKCRNRSNEKERVETPVSKEFINMAFKSRAVGTTPPLRRNLYVHREFARNTADTHFVVTRLPAQISTSDFFLKVSGGNVSADICKCIHLQPKSVIFLSLHFDFDIHSPTFFHSHKGPALNPFCFCLIHQHVGSIEVKMRLLDLRQ